METVTFKLSSEEKTALSVYADERDISISRAMREIVQTHQKGDIQNRMAEELRLLRAEVEALQQGMEKQAMALAALVLTDERAQNKYAEFLDGREQS